VPEDDHEPEPDGRQFDAVTRFEEPAEPGAEGLGPEIPEPPQPSGEAHPRVRFLFWALVGVFNVALLVVGVGLLALVFTDRNVLALHVLGAGLLILAYGLYRYRDARREVATLAGGEEKG